MAVISCETWDNMPTTPPQEMIGHIRQNLTQEELLRFGYVPFVICRLVWDYTDTIKDLCILMRLSETKKMTRAVRELREAYERERLPYINVQMRDNEESNMVVFENMIERIMSLYLANLRSAIEREQGELKREHKDLLIAVYQCHVLLRAVIKYARKQADKVSEKLKWNVRSVLPRQIFVLDDFVLEFAGDCRLSAEWEKVEAQFADTFANQIGLIALTDRSPVEQPQECENVL